MRDESKPQSPAVLFVAPDFANPNYHGGIQVFNGYLHRALIAAGARVRAIGFNDRPRDARAFEHHLAPCSAFRPARKLLCAALLVRELLWRKPDVVLCGHLNFTPLCGPICARFGVPMVTITHGIEAWSPPPNLIAAAVRSTLILCVSRFTRRRVLDRFDGVQEGQVAVFPNTFDHERFTPRPRSDSLRKRLGIGPDDRVILTVCRLARTELDKGFYKVLEVLPGVLERVPQARYVLAGAGDELATVRQRARELGLEDRMILPGFVADRDLVDLFNLCDVFVMPSTKEGFGIVYLEAMACGKPVIAGNKDGSVDPLMDGEAGVLVDPDSTDEIRRAIIDVLTGSVDSSLLEPERIRARVIEEFGLDRFVARTREMIGRVLA